MADIKISPDVIDVLNRSSIEGNVLVLPEGQLDRPLYEAVNKVLKNAGGAWKRGKGHVFPSDPRAKLGLALETGVSVDEKKKFQAFFTPPALASRVVELADVSGCSVLEPSAGEGALVKECLAQGCGRLFAVEINPEAREAFLERVTACNVSSVTGDFLDVEPGVGAKFDRVVMNPPFTKGQDIKHVLHALKFLKPGGRLVAVMSGEVQSKPAFDRLLESESISGYTVEPVPAGAFKESGTNVSTVIVVIDKRK